MNPLHEYTGKVVEIIPTLKAIVEFEVNNKKERALLWYNNLKSNGNSLPSGGCIKDYLKIGNSLKFICHKFDASGVDRCGWYITSASVRDVKNVFINFPSDKIINGLHNYTGTIVELAKRQGILSFTDNQGKENYVRFLGSKLYLFGGKHIKNKTNLDQVQGLDEGNELLFDAVPCNETVDGKCTWFATAVWRNKKPYMDYDSNRIPDIDKQDVVAQIKQISLNPRNRFLKSTGQIMEILNEEYGLALGALKENVWQSVLFHRSSCYLLDCNLANEDLTKIFKEGDKIYLVAAPAPKELFVKWLAIQVGVFVDPSVPISFLK